MDEGRGPSQVRGDIEGLRAVAIIAVVLYHADLLASGGFIGVDVFFVISGFVITRSLVRRHDDTGTTSIVDFYVRRAKRILPAITAFIVLALPMVLIMGSAYEFPRSRDTAAASTVFMANFQLLWEGAPAYFGSLARENAFLHTWSLSVEEQFYLVFPVVMVACMAIARRRPRSEAAQWTFLRTVLLSLAVASFVLMIVVSASDRQAAFYLAPTRAWEFLAGAALAVTPMIASRAATPIRVGGIALIGGSCLLVDSAYGWPGPLTAVPVIGALMVIAVAPGTGGYGWLLDNPPMRRLGELSYGWYLWHWPAILVAQQAFPRSTRIALVAGLLAVVPAAISLRVLENPIRFSSVKRPGPVLGGAVASVVFLLVFVVVLVPAADRRIPGSVSDINHVADLQFIQDTEGCSRPAQPRPELCTSLVSADAPRAVLVGDSEAAQLAIPFHQAATQSGFNGRVHTKLSCAFLPNLSVLYDGASFPGCDEHNSRVFDQIRASPPHVVVMSNHVGFPLDASGFVDLDADRQLPAADAADVLAEAMTDTVRGIQSLGSRVVIVRRPPPVSVFSVYDCARWRWILDQATCGVTRPIDEARAWRAPEDVIIDKVVAATGATVVDPGDLSCTEQCDAIRDGAWVYGDNAHLTRQFVPALTPLLIDAFERVDR